MKYGINKNGINYFLISESEYFCTYFSSEIDIEITVKNTNQKKIEKITVAELIKLNSNK
jgi:hypothetical protein